jgi:hypothetical protein
MPIGLTMVIGLILNLKQVLQQHISYKYANSACAISYANTKPTNVKTNESDQQN